MPLTQNTPIILEVEVTPDGILLLQLGGNLYSEEAGAQLSAWVEKAKSAILELKKRRSRILCITDVSKLENFDDGTFTLVKDFASWAGARDVRTAVLGASLVANMALRSLILMSGRKNIKSFKNNVEALAWLKEGK